VSGKAATLVLLRAAGEPVPPFVVLHPGEPVVLPGAGPFAVRSSASGEDATHTARAGQHLTFLDVAAADAPARVAACFADQGGGQVIVQQMVAAELSGVAFSVDPRGVLNREVVEVGRGAGAVTAEGRPTTTHYDCEGLRHAEGPPDAPTLTDAQLDDVLTLTRRAADLLGRPVDVEYAFAAGRLWALQARPITALPPGQPVTLDASNIVESYPGLSLPLTQSFAQRAYRGVFTALARRVLGSDAAVAPFRPVLDAMVAPCSGRVWYRIDHWYTALQLLPLGRRFVPVWQDMLGVQHRAFPRVRLPWRARLGAAPRVVASLHATRRLMSGLSEDVTAVAERTHATLASATTLAELAAALDEIEQRLLARWDVTLLNDLRAFAFTGLLTRALRVPPAHLAQLADVVSLEPLRELIRLAHEAPPDVLVLTGREQAHALLAAPGAFTDRLRAFVDSYGDRYLAELKLESPTFRTHPELLLDALRAHQHLPVPTPAPQPPLPRLVQPVHAKTADAIRAREASRLERARVYGLARALVRRAGELLVAARQLDTPNDVFWLTLDEVFDPPADARARIAERRGDYAGYAQLPAWPRLVFAGEPVDLHPRHAHQTSPSTERELVLRGTGAAPGVGEGVVRVVRAGETPAVESGEVLVAAMTDPGWVFLLSRAAAVVSERGSLLSHTAIMARELGTPFVTGVEAATTRLRDGERVRVDGATGRITRVDDLT